MTVTRSRDHNGHNKNYPGWMMGKLDGRVAIVTGSGRGIGRATAELFAEHGAKIVVATKTAAPGQEVVDAIVAKGGEALLVEADIGSRAAVESVVARTVEHFGKLDIVVHNAAYIPHAELPDITDEMLNSTFNVGVMAAFWLTQAALPHLERSEAGRILITSSLAGNRQSYIGLVPYGAVKAALNGFIRGAALELAAKGITVNGIEPGLTLGYHLQTHASTKVIEALSEKIPLKRPAQPVEMGHGFLYLASDDAKYVTGQTIAIDGGSSIGDPRGLGLDNL